MHNVPCLRNADWLDRVGILQKNGFVFLVLVFWIKLIALLYIMLSSRGYFICAYT
jgi:hypothetical protein